MAKSETLAAGRATLHVGDCLKVLKGMAENTFDACIVDPPYHLQSIQKRFAKSGRTDKTRTTAGPFQRHARGFMNQQWDGGSIAFEAETWSRVLRTLKPGAFLLAFGATRSYHRMACAIEDAGFEVRDCIQWLYGQGFPKSLNIAREMEKRLCVVKKADGRSEWFYRSDGARMADDPPFRDQDAQRWAGWGTAFKPAVELICVARKPLSEKTVIDNVKKWGTGALNIEATRIAVGDDVRDVGRTITRNVRDGDGCTYGLNQQAPSENVVVVKPEGRWPANVIHDGSPEVMALFPDAPGQQRPVDSSFAPKQGTAVYGDYGPRPDHAPRGDSGSAGRFFFSPKADADDRIGSGHPSVKPIDLLQYLVRACVPYRGLILDPFAGTGTTAEAAIRENCRAVLIEREPAYCDDIRRRMKLVMSGPEERARESIKAKTAGKPVDAGPLFGGAP